MDMISIDRRSIGLLCRGLLTAVLVGGLMLAGFAIPRAHADDADGANRYGGCLAAQKSGDLLLLFDESSSLQSTDAKAARVSAATYLVQTLASYADRVGADLDVAIAGFADYLYVAPELDQVDHRDSRLGRAATGPADVTQHRRGHRLLARPRRCPPDAGITGKRSQRRQPLPGHCVVLGRKDRLHGAPAGQAVRERHHTR